MVRKSSEIARRITLDFPFPLLIFLLFATLGSKVSYQTHLRLILGCGVILSVLLWKFREIVNLVKSWPVLFFGAFILFQGIRWFFYEWIHLVHSESVSEELLAIYQQGFLMWLFNFATFCSSFVYTTNRQSAGRVGLAFVISAFFLAMNSVPALLQRSGGYYFYGDNRLDRKSVV